MIELHSETLLGGGVVEAPKNMGKKRGFSRRVRQSTEIDSPKRKYERTELDASKYLEKHEIDRLFSVIRSKRDKAVLRVTYHRGLRAHEVGILELADFRNRDGVLFVKRGKGSISREHSLCDEELKALRAYIRDVRGSDPGPLFPSRQSRTKGISRQQLDRLIKRYGKLAGLAPEKCHMHALKHSCGTHLAERGAEAQEIQDWLGHRDSQSTDIYMHFSRKRRQASYERHRDWR
jgi:site-specific recombinase XerD